MYALFAFAWLQAADPVGEPRLSIWELIARDLPRDPLPVTLCIIVAFILVALWWYNRKNEQTLHTRARSEVPLLGDAPDPDDRPTERTGRGQTHRAV